MVIYFNEPVCGSSRANTAVAPSIIDILFINQPSVLTPLFTNALFITEFGLFD